MRDYFSARTRRLISRSTASRMNSARFPGPASSSICSATPAGKRTSIGFTSIFGRPMRGLVADIALCVKTASFPISLIDTYPISLTLAIRTRGETHMARIRYFADMPNGETIDLGIDDGRSIRWVGGPASLASSFSGRHEGRWLKATRKVVMKPSPSRHDCDARCYNATGRTMNCECACGGKNHGRGAFRCEAA